MKKLVKFLFIFSFPTKPILTSGQIDRLSNIFDSSGQVIFGIMVVSPLVNGIDKIDIGIVVLGLVTVLFCWTGSIYLAKNKNL